MAGECVRECFDKKRQGEAFVTEVRATQRQDRSSLLAIKNARIIGRLPIAVDKPRPGQPFSGCCQSIAQPVGS